MTDDRQAPGRPVAEASASLVYSRLPRAAWFVIAASVIVTASAAGVLAIRPLWLVALLSDQPELVELVASKPARSVEGRLTGGYDWSPSVAASRSPLPVVVQRPEVHIAIARTALRLANQRSAATLHAHASARLLLGDVDAAKRALEEAVGRRADSAKLQSDYAAALLESAAKPDHAFELPRALEATEQALVLNGRLPEAQFNKALVLERLHLRDQAIAAWERYVELDSRTPWASEARQRQSALKDQGSIQPGSDAGALRDLLFDDDLPAWAKAVESKQSGNDELRRVRDRVRAIDAGSADRLARRIVERLDGPHPNRRQRDLLLEGLMAYSAARAAHKEERFEVALPTFARAHQALSLANSPLAGFARLYEGIALFRLRKLDAAAVALEHARATFASDDYPCLSGRVDWMLGLIDASQGRHQSAAARYALAIIALRNAGEAANVAFVHGLLASHFDRLGNPVLSWQVRVNALAGTGREGPLLGSAVAAAALGSHRAAAIFAQASADVARNAGRSATLADAFRVQAVARGHVGDVAGARSALAEARRVIGDASGAAWDRLRAETDLADASTSMTGDRAAGIDAATRALRYFQSANALGRLTEIHMIRAQLLRASGRGDEAEQDLRDALAGLARIRQYIAAGVDQATFTDVVRRLVDEYVSLQASRGTPDRAFVATEGARARDLPSMIGAADPTVDGLKQTIAPRTVLMDFVVGDRESYGWCIRRGHARFVTIVAGRSQLAQLVDAATAPRNEPAALQELRRALIEPFEQLIEPDDLLVVVPDGPLHLLPFAALPGRQSKYLIEEHAVLLSPSVTAWMRSSAQLAARRAAPAEIAAIGNPRFDRATVHLPDLPGAAKEAQSIARFYENRSVAVGAAATRDFTTGAFTTSEVVHFAGHALINTMRPLESELVVWDPLGRRLTVGDIRALQAPRARLVVLAACQSTIGLMTRAEGPLGLARAFLAAGVPAVIASQWLVDDSSSLELFILFHAEYAKTGDAARALQTAQRTFATSSTDARRLPSHWAGFVAIGGSAAIVSRAD